MRSCGRHHPGAADWAIPEARSARKPAPAANAIGRAPAANRPGKQRSPEKWSVSNPKASIFACRAVIGRYCSDLSCRPFARQELPLADLTGRFVQSDRNVVLRISPASGNTEVLNARRTPWKL